MRPLASVAPALVYPGTHFFGWFDDGVQPGIGVVGDADGVGGAVAVGVAVGLGEGAGVGSGGGVRSAGLDARGVGLGARVGVDETLGAGEAVGAAANVGSGGGVRSAGLDGAAVVVGDAVAVGNVAGVGDAAGSGVGDAATATVALGAGVVGRATFGAKVVGTDVLAVGASDDEDPGGACNATNAESAEAFKRPSGPARTSSVEPNIAPGRPAPPSERSKDGAPRSLMPVAVSVNAPPGSIDVMTARYVPGTALGSSMSCGSLPGALAAQPGTCRTIVAPDELMPHDRPSGSMTMSLAGECMPKRSVVDGAGIGAGAAGASFRRTVVCWPCVRTTISPRALTSTSPSVTCTVVSPEASTSVRKPVPRTVAVVVGVLISNLESARVSRCTLAHVRPTTCSISILIDPFAFAAAALRAVVVDGSSSSVDPSKNVISACPTSSVRTRS